MHIKLNYYAMVLELHQTGDNKIIIIDFIKSKNNNCPLVELYFNIKYVFSQNNNNNKIIIIIIGTQNLALQ